MKKVKAKPIVIKSLPSDDEIISLIYSDKYNKQFPENNSHYGSAIKGAIILRNYLKRKTKPKQTNKK